MDFKLFGSELLEKLKVAGIPMLEDDLIKLNVILFDHLGSFDYENAVAKALMPAAAAVLKPLAEAQLEQIDKSDNPT